MKTVLTRENLFRMTQTMTKILFLSETLQNAKVVAGLTVTATGASIV